MRTRRHIGRIAKWTFTIAACLLLATWLLTLHYRVYYQGLTNQFSIHHDCVFANYQSSPAAARASVDRAIAGATAPGWMMRTDPPGGSFRSYDPGYGFKLPRFYRTPMRSRNPSLSNLNIAELEIPLWLPVLALALPSAALWYRDRRHPAKGHCPSCNYNMTGNVSGKCPECGTFRSDVPNPPNPLSPDNPSQT